MFSCEYPRSCAVVSLFLDENLADNQIARQLQAAGFTIYTPRDTQAQGLEDPDILETATGRQAVVVTYNQRHFVPLHDEWQRAGREHCGILVSHELSKGELFSRLEHAARLLRPEIARNHLMELSLFDTEARAQAYVISLSPPSSA